MKNFRKNNGITLIALVITIIVLLILAGVSIAMLTGQNGILTQAQNAKNATEQAQKQEENILNSYEDIINGNYIEIKQVTDENPGVLEGTGTDTDPYTINSIEDLVVFASNVTNGTTYEGQTVELGLNLDFNSDKSYVEPLRTDYAEYGYDGELKTLLTTGKGFKPIGKYDVQEGTNENIVSQNNFEGVFDGNDNVIKNLYINKVGENKIEEIGLFANNCGEIKNLGLIDVNIYVNGESMITGGIAGATFGNITACYVTGEIKCDVTLWSMVGGITGNARIGLQIAECSNSANITINNLGETGQAVVAGIIGNSELTDTDVEINKCYNSGNIYGYSEKNTVFVGGIATILRNGKIMNCYNTGKIEGKGTNSTYIGGILGNTTADNENNEIRNCYNIGEIIFSGEVDNSEIFIGGIVGYSINTNISNVYNAKEIKINGQNSNIRIGGLCATFLRETIANGYNIGNIIAENTTSENIGGVIGSTSSTVILKNCYYLKGTYLKAIGLTYGLTEENNDTTELENLTDFPNILEVINSDNVFKEDTNNINNGNPILAWQ